MDRYFESTPARLERWLIVVAVVGSTLLFWRDSLDVFGTPKLTLVLICGVGLVALGVYRVLTTAHLRLPRSVPTYVLLAFLVAGVVAVFVAPSWWRAVVGQRGRGSGFAMYVTAALLLVAVVRSVDLRRVPRLISAIVAGGAVAALYALLQKVGGDPFDWSGRFPEKTAFSTLGNVNFASGYLGTVTPLAAWGAVAGSTRGWRVTSACVLAACLGGLLAATSAQGPIAAAAGLAVFGAVWLSTRRAVSQLLWAALGGAAAVATLVVVLGVTGVGPLRSLNESGLSYRRDLWEASVEMTKDHPIAGVGFDSFGGYFRAYRDADEARIADTSDEPHSVPLGMFAGGGLLLGGAYLVFVGSIGWVLLRGLRRSDGAERLLLGGLGSAWLAYHVQSFVSIDVPAFPPLHFVLAGLALLAAGAVTWIEVPIPGLVLPEQRGKMPRRRRRVARSEGWVAVVVAALVLLVGAWRVTLVQRADLIARDAERALRSGDLPLAQEKLVQAMRTARDEPEYYSMVADYFYETRESPRIALDIYQGALERDPRRFVDTANAARSARFLGDVERAEELYNRAIELEPHAPELLVDLAKLYAVYNQESKARATIERIMEKPLNGFLWLALGDIYFTLGDVDDAREAYVRSRALDEGGGGVNALNQLDQGLDPRTTP